ncbi:hypothetical protein KAU33_05835 [Candidatus Dependentiae bacterium]|nr:hypothetical protein [Candidatus Dependentiae bacterium]
MKIDKYDLRSALRKVFRGLHWNIKYPKQDYIKIEGSKLSFDAFIKINDTDFVTEIKSIRKFNTLISTIFYRSIVKLNALSRNMFLNPLIIFMLEEIITLKELKALGFMFRKYAPDFSWVLINSIDDIAYKLKGLPIQIIGFEKSTNLRIELRNNLMFSFTDLELWMFKVLFYHNYKKHETPIPNAFSLSKLAGVNRNTANKWVKTMLENNFIISRRGESLKLFNIRDYFNLWTGRYSIFDQEIYYFNYIRNDKEVFTNIFKKFEKSRQSNWLYLLTGYLGSRSYNLKFTSSESIQIYSSHLNFDDIKKSLLLIPSESRTNIMVIIPKYYKSVIGGLKFSKNNYTVDPIQLYLDCFHLKGRGYQQADRIYKELIINE